ncbi:MAG: hypothetical protein ACE5HS_01955 [bacterium]
MPIKINHKIFIAFIILMGLVVAALAQEDQYFTLNTVNARPLAMGGAFMAVGDDLPAINFNPAGYMLDKDEDSRRFTFYVNPMASFLGVIDRKDLFKGSGSKIDDILLSTGLLLKALSMRVKSFEVGLLLGEQNLRLPDAFTSERFVEATGYRQNHSHSIVGRLRLAEKVSLGGTVSIVVGSRENDPFARISDLGISYGIILKPANKLKVGVSFVNLPDSIKHYREDLERIVDESVNIGLSYRLFDGTLLAFDMRNLGEDDEAAVREFHFGAEQQIMSQVALRAGYYKKSTGEHVISGGIGLLNLRQFMEFKSNSIIKNYCLNYSFIYEKSALVEKRWHLFTVVFKI